MVFAGTFKAIPQVTKLVTLLPKRSWRSRNWHGLLEMAWPSEIRSILQQLKPRMWPNVHLALGMWPMTGSYEPGTFENFFAATVSQDALHLEDA